jgi:SAM-dependent methyltransferase
MDSHSASQNVAPWNSVPWNWRENTDSTWLEPSEESYYLVEHWAAAGFRKMLDLGCGLGRHALLFARNGFEVSALDLSSEAVGSLTTQAAREGVSAQTMTGDMHELPYADASFDCLLAYHVISHTTRTGMERIIGEMLRVLRPGAEFFFTICSKDTWSFKEADFPHIDEDTVIKTADGPEKGVPHFYMDLDGILAMSKRRGFDITRIRHVDDCWFNNRKQNSKHYFVLGKKR